MSTVAVSPAPLQLTRRGRVVVFLAVALLVMLAAVFLGATSVATDSAGEGPQQTEVIMVDSGQTLWSIAAERAEDGKVREMVDHIKRLNALDSAMLMAGQELHVPVD